MCRLGVTVFIVSALCCVELHAQVQACQCSDGVAGTDFQINQGEITILTGANNNYQFFARDPNNPSLPVDIVNIVIDSGATGNLTITIDSNQVTSPGVPGARNLAAANLRYADPNDGIVTVLGITLSERIATDDDVLLDAVSGDIVAFGLASGATATERLSANVMDANLALIDLDGDFEVGVMNGAIRPIFCRGLTVRDPLPNIRPSSLAPIV